MAAIVGGAGLRSTYAAVSSGRICLANKEALVVAGELMIVEARRSGVPSSHRLGA